MAQKRARRVTLKDIAQATGYSVITVSKALRKAGDISESTKALIEQKAREMQYVHNGAANALRSGRAKMLALTLVDISNPFWSAFAKQAEESARAKGYSLLIMNTDMDGVSEERAIRAAIARGIDGMLIDPSMYYLENVRILQASGIPYLIVGCNCQPQGESCVWFDDYLGGKLAAERFLRLGRRHLLMLSLPEWLSSATERVDGFLDALAARDAREACVSIRYMPSREVNSDEIIAEELAAHPEIDGIFASSDRSALAVASILMDMGKRIPEDISLIGFGDLQSHLRIPFGLTTLHAAPFDLARCAVGLLMDALEDDASGEAIYRKLPVSLVERMS